MPLFCGDAWQSRKKGAAVFAVEGEWVDGLGAFDIQALPQREKGDAVGEFTVASWNINSVRLRIQIVEKLLRLHAPDVLCLQETKCADASFPAVNFRDAGYPYMALNGGRGGYHGVAIVSKLPLNAIAVHSFCNKGDPRHISAVVAPGDRAIRLHNFYVPAGGDEPDREVNEKFDHKLRFLDEMHDWLPVASPDAPDLILGDLNIAPHPNDVWSHTALLKVVSHTPVECEKLEAIRTHAGKVDLARHFVPLDQKLATWWSYRAADWRASNRGRRLDHIWADPALAALASAHRIIDEARDWPRPSDHVPVLCTFKL